MPKDQRPPPRERESIWSVAKGWLPWYLFLIFSLLFSWVAFVAWLAVTYGDYPALGLLVEAVIIKFSGGVIGIAIVCLAAVTIADTGGGSLVVTYRYLNNKFVEPIRRQLRQEGREQGREEGLEQGREQGIDQGIEQGIAQGREQGIAQGREQGFEQGREQGIAQGREQGIAQGIAQGRQEGIAQSREQVQELKIRTLEWYARQQQALAKGEPFNEPPPFFSSANGHDPAGK